MGKIEKLKHKPQLYGNTWVVVDGIKFQSIGESQYYLRLKDDLRKGEIRGFKRQVEYKFIINNIYITTYKADFVVLHNDGTTQVLDYKSRFTQGLAMYQIKKALMKVCFGIIVKEVGKNLRPQ